MQTPTKLSAHVATVARSVQRRLRVGGALLVFPALLPRFGEPSAILIAEITCPQATHTVAAGGAKSVTPPSVLHSSIAVNAHRTREAVAPVMRPSLAVRLREMWESRGRTLPAVDRARTPAPVATRTRDLPRS